jgi:TRAP-type C4-dicarboxylate transport system permease small subunit
MLPMMLPKPPLKSCPAQSRAGILCFWTVLLLFFAGIGYLGLLAYTRNAGQPQPNSGISGHLVSGLLLVGCAIAAVISVIATRYKRLH